MTTAWLCQIDAVARAGGAASTLRLASHDDDRLCHLDAKVWWPSIARLPTFSDDFFDGAFGGEIATPAGKTDVSIEAVPGLAAAMLHGARIRWWSGEMGATWAAFTLQFDGLVENHPAARDGIAAIEFKVDDAWLDDPILSTYAGTSGAEGEAGLKGQVKPLLLGAPRMTEGVLINSIDTVVQLNDGPIAGVDVAMENADRAFGFTANFASYAALVAATIAPGFYATALAVGMVRHGAPPEGVLTYDVQGSNAGSDGGGQVRRTGAIVKRIAARMGKSAKVDAAALSAIDVARPWNVSVAVTQQTTLRELAQSLAQSINAVARVTWTGLLTILPIDQPETATPVGTLASDGSSLPPVARVDQLAIASPFWRCAIEAVVTNRVHGYDEIRFTAPLVPRGRYSASETYREGQTVDLADGSVWLFTATSPSSGHAPPVWPINSNAWWFNLTPPMKASGITYDDGQSVEDLQPAEPGATEGAVVPDPASGQPGNVKDETGTLRPASDLLNTSLSLSSGGLLEIIREGGSRTSLGQVRSSAIGAASEGAVRLQSDALEKLAVIVTMIDTRLANTQEVMRDAGIYVDPTNGRVTISAIDATAERVNDVTIALDAVSATLELKASTSYVDAAIATAVIDPSQIPVFQGIEARLTSAEVRLDGVDATLVLKADAAVVDALSASLTAASIEIDALQGTITTKVDSATFTALESRVATAEDSLSALGDTAEIARGISVARLIGRQQEDAVAATLAGLIAGDKGQREQVASLALAREEITTRLIDGDAAEAQARTILAARVNTAEAAIVTEQTVRSSAVAAISQSVTEVTAALSTETTNRTAAVTSEENARVSADGVLSGRIDVVEAAVTDEISARQAAVTEEATARVDGDGALSTLISDVSASVALETGARIAAVTTEAGARATADGALSGRIDTVEAAVTTEAGTRAAAITNEANARADADGAIATSLGTLSTTVGGHTASITAFGSSINGLQLRYGWSLNANGHAIGWVANNNGTSGGLDFVVDYFRIWKSDGLLSKAPFEFRNGSIFITTAAIEDLSVDTIKIAGNAITVPVVIESASAFVGPAQGEYTLLETGWLNVGTGANPASVLLGCYSTVSAAPPPGGGPDGAVDFRIYCDRNDGNGYQMVGFQAVGIDVTSGDAYFRLPVAMVELVTGIVDARFRVTARAVSGPQGAAARTSAIGGPTLVVQGAKR